MRAAILVGALLVAPLALAGDDPCDVQDPATLTIPDDSGALGGDLYVVNDMCQFDGCLFSIWIYQESNGHAGLQRGDAFPTWGGGCEDPDRVVF